MELVTPKLWHYTLDDSFGKILHSYEIKPSKPRSDVDFTGVWLSSNPEWERSARHYRKDTKHLDHIGMTKGGHKIFRIQVNTKNITPISFNTHRKTGNFTDNTAEYLKDLGNQWGAASSDWYIVYHSIKLDQTFHPYEIWSNVSMSWQKLSTEEERQYYVDEALSKRQEVLGEPPKERFYA